MEDTIAAVATALGEGAIAIIRISGAQSRSIIERIFRPRREGSLIPYHLRLGWIVDTSGEPIDEVLVTWMPAGGSYTAEQMAEVQCHGGIIAARTVLRTILQQGAREALPGEFTLRAFLNGRLSLNEAEAVLDVIRAPAETGLKTAVMQLSGALNRVVEPVFEALRSVVAQLEAAMDFPEDIGEIDLPVIRSKLVQLQDTLREVLRGSEQGRVLREGLTVSLIGRPNAGKSSLLNALLGEERAIVTSIPGTTRDVLEEVVEWDGLPIRLQDTAGLGSGSDLAETMAIEKAKKTAREADVVLLVFDGSEELKPDLPGPEFKPDRTVIAVNKSDLFGQERVSSLKEQLADWPLVFTSAKEGTGLDQLRQAVISLVAQHGIRQGATALVSRERQRRLLESAIKAIAETCEAIESEAPLECVSVNLLEAMEKLGELLGRNPRMETLEAIFSEFCIGK